MASDHLPNHLLSHRKRSALSQEEVAFLVGAYGAAKVCRHERFTLDPGLQTALAYEAIYHRPIHELFPGLAEKVENEIRERVRILEQKELPSQTDALKARKRQSLAAILPPGLHNQLN